MGVRFIRHAIGPGFRLVRGHVFRTTPSNVARYVYRLMCRHALRHVGQTRGSDMRSDVCCCEDSATWLMGLCLMGYIPNVEYKMALHTGLYKRVPDHQIPQL